MFENISCDNPNMSNVTIEITQEELLEMRNAYQTLQRFLDKIVSPNELYTDEFLEGLGEAQADIEAENYTEVKTFADFIG